MLARCVSSLPSQLLLGRRALINAWGDVCCRVATISLADISPLLLLEHYVSGNEVADRKQHKDKRVEPEIRKSEPLGKGADADRLEPSRWKRKADRPCRTSQ